MFAELDFSNVDGVILDAVGTLIEPRPSVAEAYAQAALRQGVSLDVLVVKERFREHFPKRGFDEARGEFATSEEVEHRRWRQIVAGCLPEVADPDRAFEELWVHFGEPSSWVVFADVDPALQRLKASGLRICVGSNFDARLRRVAAGFATFHPLESSFVISSEVGFRKPHAKFYEAACHHLGLPANRVVCVGDHPEDDFRGPIRAGLRAARIERGAASRVDPPTYPDLVEFADEVLAARGRDWKKSALRADKGP